MKIAVVGGTESALELSKLLKMESMGPAAMLIQPPDPHEDQRSYLETVGFAQAEKIPYLSIKKFGSEAAEFLAQHKVHIGCLINCRFLIPEKYLTIIGGGFLATHGSILPEYRGFAPLNWAIINGKNEIGITLFRAAANVDSGHVLATKLFSIDGNTTASEIFSLFVLHQPKMFVDAIKKYQKEKTFDSWQVEQSMDESSYCCRRTPQDSEIDWQLPGDKIMALLRASQPPYPYAFTFYKGTQIGIVDASYPRIRKKYVGIVPGRVNDISRADGSIEVLCGDGPLWIRKIQYNDSIVAPTAIIRSLKDTLGLNHSQEIMGLRKEVENLKSMILDLKK